MLRFRDTKFKLAIFLIAHLKYIFFGSGNFRKKNEFRPQEKLAFDIAQRFSFRKYRSCAQTYYQISVSSII